MTTTGVDMVLRRIRSMSGTFAFPHQAAALLDNPVRRLMDDPAAAVDALDLVGGERVLELGPGPGFFSIEIANRLTTGRLDLFDLQPEMLDKAMRKLASANYHEVGLHSGDASAPLPFSDNTFDCAFLAEVIGEVDDKPACLRSLMRVLKGGGLLVFYEAFPDPDRLSAAELRELAEPEGFDFVDARGNRWRDSVRFRKPI